ncbi:MAG: BMP family protein [Rhodobacteraceae bacterium]|nr:BMP family protein [Paracoccaceae bacterium]
MLPKISSLVASTVLAIGVATSAQAEEFKVGLLTGGSATESGWNKIAYDALMRTRDELGAEVSFVELDHNPASYEKAFLDFADQDYDIVIGHGFEFQDAAMSVAPDYPDTTFLITSSFEYNDNMVGITLTPFQPFYLMGVLAAHRGNKAGYIGGMKIPPIEFALKGFTAGAKSVNPDFEVLSVFIGNFSDSAAVKEAAITMIANGATMIVPNADSAALGAFQAVSEAKTDVVAFGAFADFTESAPKQILGNYVPDFGQGIVEVAQQIRDGDFNPGHNIVFGLESDTVLKITFNENASQPVTSEERAALDKAKAGLISGEIPQ